MDKFEADKKMIFFLHLKHWQIFLLFFGLSIFASVFVITTTLLTKSYTAFYAFSTSILNPVLTLVFYLLFIGWWWTLGVRLHTRLPAQTNLNIKRFRKFFLIQQTYLIFFVIFVLAGMYLPDFLGAWAMLLLFIFVMLPLHLFSMFVFLYVQIFIAKALKSVELQRNIKFKDYWGEFILFSLFHPIGVWWLQPRINKIFSNEKP